MNISHFKGLRAKMLLALTAGTLLFCATLFIAVRLVLIEGYERLEKDKTFIQIDTATSIVNEQAEQLSTVTRDYAHWDETYSYIENRNAAFIESNFNNTTFSNLKVNAILLIDADGKPIFKKSLNFVTGEPWHIPDLLLRALTKDGELANPTVPSISGLFWTKEGVCVVSVFDVLDSELKKKSRGRLVFVRLLDDTLKNKISEMLGAKISIEGLHDDEIAFISPNLAKNKPVAIPLNDKSIAGFSIINALGSDAKLVLSTVSDRKIFQQGKTNLIFLYWLSAFVLFLLAAFSLFLDKIILSRLTLLNKNVTRIGKSTTTSERIEQIHGEDEMASLAQGINGMLARLDASQESLQLEKDLAQTTLSTLTGIADAVVTSNEAGCVVFINKAAEKLTGVVASKAIGMPLHTIFHLVAEDKTSPVDSSWLVDAHSTRNEVLLKRADGQEFYISKSSSALYDKNNVVYGHVAVLRDVTMLKALSDQLSYQARHDPLTNLANRYEFDHKTEMAIDDAANNDRVHSLVYFDLDKFKVVNDSCGHLAGDLLLRQLADLLKTKIRSADTFARIGGDEFALLLTACNSNKALDIANELLNTIQEYRFNYDNKIFRVGASIGIAEISPNNQYTLKELLSKADVACFVAKNEGGNRIHTYSANDGMSEERNNQLNWVSRIHLALEKNQFVLYAQTIQSLNASAEPHCELLIRMKNEDGKLHMPGEFLPAAEYYHLMPQIDRWVIKEALVIMARKGANFKDLCAINLSGQSLSDDSFLQYILGQINIYKVNPQRLCFEITETAAIANLNKARQFMQALRAIGCRFSLDDFGSGLSSFAYLKNLEVDFLKIDGMFVKSIVSNPIDRAMVESINNVGHVMGLQTIAEFVENDKTIQILKEMGVNYAQGYGVAKPTLFE